MLRDNKYRDETNFCCQNNSKNKSFKEPSKAKADLRDKDP